MRTKNTMNKPVNGRTWVIRMAAYLWLVLNLELAVAADAGRTSTNRPACCRELAITNAPTDKSIYQLESRWTSDMGKTVPLAVLRGRPQVLALFFSNCEFACPLIVHDMKRIQEELPAHVRGQVDFTLISLDPERDTPEALAAYRSRQHLDPSHWTLLCGSASDVRELAAVLGVLYRKDSRGQFAHSNVLFVLNAEGEIVHRQIGLNQEPAETIQSLMTAIRFHEGPRK